MVFASDDGRQTRTVTKTRIVVPAISPDGDAK
jgi:hypothetical protein